MIPIAKPLANKLLASKIHEITKKLLEEKKLVSGIKACQKSIIAFDNENLSSEKQKPLMVFSASISPMDLITHIPILCEKKSIPYVFVENSEFINGFTCVYLENDENLKQLVEEVAQLL